MKVNSIARETAKILLKIEAVSFRLNPPFVFTTGLKSPIYIDNRIIMSHPDERKKIVNFYIKILKEKIGIKNVDYVSGTASAAIPQASWVSGKLHLPMLFVRPSTKSYGKGNKLEGYLKKNSRVVIIEDHVSTATSIANNALTIREAGGKTSYCITITTYQTEKSIQILKKCKIRLFALTTGKDILEEAFRQKIVSQKEKEETDLWFRDPVNWAKNMGID